jgi:hypothetical protein
MLHDTCSYFCNISQKTLSKENIYVNVTWSFVWYKVEESSSKGTVYLNVNMKFCVEVGESCSSKGNV